MQQLRVELGERSYLIYLGNQELNQLPGLLAAVKGCSQIAIITDETVDSYYGQMTLELLRSAGITASKLVITGGEKNKNLNTVEQLSQGLSELGLDRDSAVLALGGGIVGDIAGFTAASYMRGIRYIQVPTTLLAQVDSSVGGKTGVNLPGGKNLVGAFWQPQMVFIDVSLLKTLNDREYKTGLAEVIKYAVIKDADLFAYLEQNRQAILDREAHCLLEIIARCCTIKGEIVARDEKEGGERALLNLGHTFGHAFESLSAYTYNHGEAVAAGMVYAGRLAVSLGLLSAEDIERLTKLISDFGLPTWVEDLDVDQVVAAMHRDKKSRRGQLPLVLPIAIGKAVLTTQATDIDLQKTLY